MVCVTPRGEQSRVILPKTGLRGACSIGVSAMDSILGDGTGEKSAMLFIAMQQITDRSG